MWIKTRKIKRYCVAFTSYALICLIPHFINPATFSWNKYFIVVILMTYMLYIVEQINLKRLNKRYNKNDRRK